MSSKKILGRTLAAIGLAGLLILSLRSPDRYGPSNLKMLMEPDGTGVWHSLIEDFEAQHPDVRVQLIEGPPATNTREDMYATSFLSGASSYDIVYSDVIWTPKFAAAGWLMQVELRQEDVEYVGYRLYAALAPEIFYKLFGIGDTPLGREG